MLCELCTAEMFIDDYEGLYICKECGIVVPYMSNIVDFDDLAMTYKKVNKIYYSRKVYISRHLRGLAGFLFTPDRVLNKVRQHKPTNIYEIRQALKKTKLTKFNIYTHSILYSLTGIRHFKFTSEQYQSLIIQFLKIEQNFLNLGTRNIISYPYMLYKLLEANGFDTKNKIILPRSRKTRKKLKKVWRKISIYK